MTDNIEQDDTSLDDFFAKKDKSKKKAKSKISTDEIEERLERKLKKGKSAGGKTDKQRSAGLQGATLDIAVGEDEGEWNEVQEETEVDYSGLRIQNFQLQKELEEKERQESGLAGENGEDGERKDGVTGPWKQLSAKPTQPAPQATPEPEPAVAPPKSTGKYVPPGLRGGTGGTAKTGSGSTPLGMGGKGRKKVAPNVDSQEDFPSLASNDFSDSVGGEFEKVKSGGRSIEDPSKQISKLSLDNKYGALRDD